MTPYIVELFHTVMAITSCWFALDNALPDWKTSRKIFVAGGVVATLKFTALYYK